MNRQRDPLREQSIRRDLRRKDDEIQMAEAIPRRMPEPAGPTHDQVNDAVAAYFSQNPPPRGPGPTAEEIASAVSAYLIANPPRKGDTGLTGPSSKLSLGTVTLAEIATVAIAAGDRTLTFTVTGLSAGADVLLFPAAALPAGYILKSAIATAANTLQVRLQVPLIALGASYSIPCRVVVLR